MRRKREIEFAFDAAEFKSSVQEVAASIENKNGKILEVKMGPDSDTGIIVVEEDF